MLDLRKEIKRRLVQAERLWLFLDYDGTLADLAPTPEHVNPDPELVDLLTGLAEDPRIRVAVVSGRRLKHVEELVPVPGILLAGTYGVELRLPGGQRVDRSEYDILRLTLNPLKAQWAELTRDHQGFFLEDKGWTVALHARFAAENETERVLIEARRTATEAISSASPGIFRLQGGYKFLDIGPRLAHKGRTVDDLLDRFPWPGALPLCLGDNDKDEGAFCVIEAHGCIAVLVAGEPRDTEADWRLDSPQAAREWIEKLLARLAERQWNTSIYESNPEQAGRGM
jgi:trehalose 6-phosphate phosphatase